MVTMYIIVGLGNPGKKYENTRHNMGFIALDNVAKHNDINIKKIKFKALVGEGKIAGQRVVLVKPQTYMNLSGESVREVMNFYKAPMENLMVIYDDIDIELGSLRIRKFGSAGTHNGMKSIIYQLKNDRFPRMRIGIGNSGNGDLKDFVIGGFSKVEADSIKETAERANLAISEWIENGIDFAMNKYNTKKKAKNDE